MFIEVSTTPTTTKENAVNQYAILRRNGWKTPEDLRAAAGRSTKVGDTVVVRPDPNR